MANVFFGDSLTDPAGAVAAMGSLGYAVPYWPYIWASIRGETIDNRASSGAAIADQSDLIFSAAPASSSRQFVLLGTNDVPQKGDTAPALNLLRKELDAMIGWLGGTCVTARNAAWTYTGTWSNNPTAGYLSVIDRFAQDATATATVSFSGDVVRIGYTIVDGFSGLADIYVDGILKGTLSAAPPLPVSTARGRVWVPASMRLSGLGSGAHSLQLRSKSASALFIDWVSSAASNVAVHFLTVPPFADNTLNAAAAAYNAVLIAAVTEAAGDGINVTLHTVPYDRAKGLYSDGTHLTGISHHVMASCITQVP